MKNIILKLLVVFIATFFVGCVQYQNNLDLIKKQKHIILEDDNISNWLAFEKLNYYTKEDGLMLVEAKFTNTTKVDNKILYKIDWFDKNGFTIKTILSRWNEFEVQPKQSLVIKGISPSIDVSNFEIRLQKPAEEYRQSNTDSNEYKN